MKGWTWMKTVASMPPQEAEEAKAPVSLPSARCFHGASSKIAPFLFQHTYEVKSLVAFLFHPCRRNHHGFTVARDIIVKRPDLVERSTIELLVYIGTEILLNTATCAETAPRCIEDAKLVAGTIVALSDWIVHHPRFSSTPSEHWCGMTRADLMAFDECYESRLELFKFYCSVNRCNCLRVIMIREGRRSEATIDACENPSCSQTSSSSRLSVTACHRCHTTLYCSKECQHLDWSRHVKTCRDMAEATRATFDYESFIETS